MLLERRVTRIAPAPLVFDAPVEWTTDGGLTILLLNSTHLYQPGTPLTDVHNASALITAVHPAYYYAQIVIVRVAAYAKIIKGQRLLGAQPYLLADNIADFLNLINHKTITRKTIQ